MAPLRRLRRIVVVALIVLALPTGISFISTMTQPSNSTFAIQAFEWLRDHGAAGVAVQIEDIYYSLNAPSTGGPGLKTLPGRHKVAVVNLIHPANVVPAIYPPLPGEGVWAPSETWTGRASPVQLATLRPDPNYPRMVAGVAWINTARTRIVLIPGRAEPNVTIPNRGPEQVPTAGRGRLLATFNSGFKLADARGGFAYGGRTYAPLVDGMATFVHYTNGKVNIISWTGSGQAPPGIDYARQNLPLIVSGGRPNPNLSDGPEWGATLGNAIQVWRSAVGIDRHGNLIYAAANYQTVGSLAAIMIRAGAVRAMELDINT